MSGTDEKDLPIDIQLNKLLDWLVDRRWVKGNVAARSAAIRDLITKAIMDMPDVPEITELLSGAYINYFHCRRIVELLKVSEADTKNIFGRYSSQRMKDWNEILKQYEQDNLYLGECANMLHHNVNYEVPALKKSIARGQARLVDLDRKESECRSSSKLFADKFQHTCKEMNIEGKNIAQELAALPGALPAVYEEVVTTVSNTVFKAALEYYAEFLNFLLGENGECEGVCPLLNYISTNGNTSVYKWKTGVELPPLPDTPPVPDPASAAATTSDSSNAAATTDGDTIDWGDLDVDSGAGGATPAASVVAGAGDGAAVAQDKAMAVSGGSDASDGFVVVDSNDTIDWGEGGPPDIDWGDDNVAGETIDWGDDTAVVEASGTIDLSQIAIEVTGDGTDAAEAVSTRDTLLAYTETRNRVIDELLELEGFLAQRLDELRGAVDITAINQFQGASAVVQSQSSKTVQGMLDVVSAANKSLSSPRVQQLLTISSSPKYVERLVRSLEQKRDLSRNMLLKIDEIHVQRAAVQQEIAAAKPKLANLIQHSRALQKQVENDISDKYKGRPVNIIGEINTM
eukprot:m.246956 g.246956  ORF g.246956 m.246956 type:complete len:572 (-) comp22590_c0_seq3:129-1844(-)